MPIYATQDPKYSIQVDADGARLINSATLVPIPWDMPVMMFLAKDCLAVAHALRPYRARIAHPGHKAGVDERIAAFEAYAGLHPNVMHEPDTAPPQCDREQPQASCPGWGAAFELRRNFQTREQSGNPPFAADGLPARDERGAARHPDFELVAKGLGETDDVALPLLFLGYESAFVSAHEDDPERSAGDLLSWQPPSRPGHRLAAIVATADGPYAILVKPLAGD